MPVRFLGSRILFDKLNESLIISGAFGLFKKEVVIAAGGYDTSTLGEDMELVVKLHEHCLSNYIPYRIRYTIDAVCWTQVPEKIKELRGQRKRWSSGLTQCMHRYFRVNDRDRIEFWNFDTVYIYFLFYELLSPFIEFLSVILILFRLLTNSLNISYMLILTLYFVVCSLIFSVTIFFSRMRSLGFKIFLKDILKAVFLSIFEVTELRCYIAFVRAWGVACARKRKQQWGHIERKSIVIQNDSTRFKE